MKPIVGLSFFCGLVFAAISSSYAAPENITVPSGFASTFIPYTTVDKRDREPHVVRFMYISPETAAAESSQTLPEGTQIVMVERVAQTGANGETVFNGDGRMIPTSEVYRIIVSEKRPGIDAEYDEDMRIGDWEFGVFRPDGSPWPDIDFDECRECHKKAERTDYTFSVFRNLSEISRSQVPSEPEPATTPRIAAKPVF
jgi:hypothetical protein